MKLPVHEPLPREGPIIDNEAVEQLAQHFRQEFDGRYNELQAEAIGLGVSAAGTYEVICRRIALKMLY